MQLHFKTCKHYISHSRFFSWITPVIWYNINEYIIYEIHPFLQVHSEAGLSPGVYTQKHAEKCARQRKRIEERSQLPSGKRRRHTLKLERAINQGASEVLEEQSYQLGKYYLHKVKQYNLTKSMFIWFAYIGWSLLFIF